MRQEKEGSDQNKSREAVPGVDGNLVSKTGSSVAMTCSPGSGEEASTAARCSTEGWGEMGAGSKHRLLRHERASMTYRGQ